MNPNCPDPKAGTTRGSGKSSGRPAHSSRPLPRPSRVAAGVGVAAALTAIGLGTLALIKAPEPAQPSWPSLQPITVTAAAGVTIPLSTRELLALLDVAPDFGPLADPQRRASCLTGLGYAASTRVLGARPITISGHPQVLLMLPGEQDGTFVVLAVAPNCSSANTGLAADTVVQRP